MFDILIGSGEAADTLTIGTAVIIIASALLLGFFISCVYIFTHKKEQYSSSFVITLIMLPAIIAMIILLVGNNVARAFSLAGAFSLIRFRSAPGDAKDIAYVFFTLGVGLACGMGYIWYAALFAVIMCSVMAALWLCRFGIRKANPMSLKILLPEDMEYSSTFDEVLDEYTQNHSLVRVKTAEFGSLFELTYDLTLKDMAQSKAFIDKIRCKNGNLNVVLAINRMNESAMF